ncbi:MAG: guanylate kinase [Bacteroidota bacterium]
MAQGLLVVVSGCSGSGKNSVLRELLQIHPDLVYSISATTRPPRPGEMHGRDYFFLSGEQFQAALAAGDFLESAMVYGHYYGTPRAYIEEMTSRQKDVILDLDVTGALNVRAKRPDAVLIFLLPPSLSVLRTRLVNRRTDSAAEIEKRLAHADIELSAIKSYDYVVVNRDIKAASEQIRSILVAEACAVRRQDLAGLVRLLHDEEADPETHDQPPIG